MAACSKCGVEFQPKGTWQKTCWSCWKKGSTKAATSSHLNDLFDELKTHLPALIYLCQPTKHDGHAELANKATQWLTGLKNRL